MSSPEETERALGTFLRDETTKRAAVIDAARGVGGSLFRKGVWPVWCVMAFGAFLGQGFARTGWIEHHADFAYALTGTGVAGAIAALWMATRSRRRIDAIVEILDRSNALASFMNQGPAKKTNQ